MPALTKLDEEIDRDITRFCADPVGFVSYAYPWGEDGDLKKAYGPRIWQTDILEEISDHLLSSRRFEPLLISIASGHGIGKSALISWVIHWGMSTCIDCRVIVTAGTGKQLDTKTWPEVTKWFKLGINAHWFDTKAESICARDKDHERMWRADAITWSENNVDPFAGLHNKGKRIIVVYDEASSIADKIWEVTSGALTDEETEIIWLAFGNPTQNSGRFRECFGRFRHRWINKQIDSRTVDGTNKALFNQWVEDYGDDSDYVRVRVKGEFPRAGSTQFIASDIVQAARKRIVTNYEHHWKILVCDVARFGDDRSIIGLRQGMKFEILDKMAGRDTVAVAKQLMYRMRHNDPRMTVIDGDGLGAGVVDYVRANVVTCESSDPKIEVESIMQRWARANQNHRLIEFHGGAVPFDGDMYYNQRAEMWGRMRDWLENAQIPDDPEIDTDLTGPEYFFSNKNQIQLEKKEDMKKRGLASPDIGDTLAMTFATSPTAKTRDERLQEEIQAMPDPMAQHFARLKETERRRQASQSKNYWD